jgi:hypothetical protein
MLKKLARSKYFIKNNEGEVIGMIFDPHSRTLLLSGPRRWEKTILAVSRAFTKLEDLEAKKGRARHFRLCILVPSLCFLAGIKVLARDYELLKVKRFRRFLG